MAHVQPSPSSYHDLLGSDYDHPFVRESNGAPYIGRAIRPQLQLEEIFHGRQPSGFYGYQPGYPSGSSWAYSSPASLHVYEEQEARRRIMIARQRQVERVRAQALARERDQHIRRAQARQQAEELSSLVDFLSSFVEHTDSVDPRNVCLLLFSFWKDIVLTQVSLQTSNYASTSNITLNATSASHGATTTGASNLCTPLNIVPVTAAQAPNVAPRDRKGKARETPAIPLPKFTSSPPETGPTHSLVSDLLQERRTIERDEEVKDALNALLNALSGSISISVQGNSNDHSHPVEVCASPLPSITRYLQSLFQTTEPQALEPSPWGQDETKIADLPIKRTPAISPATKERILKVVRSRRARKVSLGAIQEIEDSLRSLESTFIFPSQLDFTSRPSSPTSEVEPISGASLAYTSNNKSVLAYEHALNSLLEKLDAVESGGDLEVRGRRKEVVNEVEKALKDVEKRVEESRERASLLETETKDSSTPQVEVANPTTTQVESGSGADSNNAPITLQRETESREDFVKKATSSQVPEKLENNDSSSSNEDITLVPSNLVQDPPLNLHSIPETLQLENVQSLSDYEDPEPTAILVAQSTDAQASFSPAPSPAAVSTALPESSTALLSSTSTQVQSEDLISEQPLESEISEQSRSPTLSSDVRPPSPFLLRSSPIADSEHSRRSHLSDDGIIFEQDAEIVDAGELLNAQQRTNQVDDLVGKGASRSEDGEEWSEVEA